jgi:hypothetical protein
MEHCKCAIFETGGTVYYKCVVCEAGVLSTISVLGKQRY